MITLNDKLEYMLQNSNMMIFKKDGSVQISTDEEQTLEDTYILDAILDLKALLAYVRKENPALYMKGITNDMLIKYT